MTVTADHAHTRTVSDVRDHLADVIQEASRAHEPVYILKRGRAVAAVIDAEDLERLIELAEDAEDLRAAAESRAEMAAGAPPIPWEQVKADLGLM